MPYLARLGVSHMYLSPVLRSRTGSEHGYDVALRVGDPEVFAATHELVLGWVSDGSVDALRVDHVDGLYDPRAYLDRLRDSVRTEPARHVPIFVEKILTAYERLPRDWPVDGTTGYEFFAQLDALFIDPAGRSDGVRSLVSSRMANGHTARN